VPKEGYVSIENAGNYVPCPYCFGYYEKRQMWRHCKRRCLWRPQDGEKDETKVVAKGSLLLPVPQHIPNQTKNVLHHMRKDEVYTVAVNDPLIMHFAHKLTLKHYADPDRHEHIRCKIRELGWLMVQVKKDHGITSLEDILDPMQFQKLVSCARKVSGFDDETNTFATPSLALKLGHALKKCAVFNKRSSFCVC